MATVYKVPNPNDPKVMDYYDAATNQKITNPHVLQTQYRGATEVAAPGGYNPNTNIADSTPSIIRPGAIGMSDWKGYQSVKDAAAEIIKIRQGANRDLTDSTAFWKAQMANSSNTDPRLNELSPADQASIRLSKQATANAALYANDQERSSRDKMGGDAFSNIKDVYDINSKDTQNAADNAYRDRALAADTNAKTQQLILDKIQAGIGNYSYDGNGNLISTPTGATIATSTGAMNLHGYAKDDNSWGKAITGILTSVPRYTVTDNQTSSSQYPTSYDSYIAHQAGNSKLIGSGNNIKFSADKYGIDPALLLSVVGHESGWGTFPGNSEAFKANNNIGGIKWNPGSMPASWKGSSRPASEGGYYVKFPTIADSIDFTAKTIKGINDKNVANVVKTQTSANTFNDNDLDTYAQTINLGNPQGSKVVTREDLKSWSNQDIMDELRVIAEKKAAPKILTQGTAPTTKTPTNGTAPTLKTD